MESVVVVSGGRIYCIGGAGKTVRSVISIGAGEALWRTEADVPTNIIQSSGCVLDGIIYVSAFRKGLIAFDPAAGTWQADLPACPRENPSASLTAACKGEVWVRGGSGTKSPRAVWKYSPRTREWTAGPDLPTPLCWGAAAELDGRLVIAGGAYGTRGIYVFSNRAYRLR